MSDGITNAGGYNNKLNSIYSTILESKTKNGEIKTEADKQILLEEIAEAYDRLASTAGSAENIALAMKNLDKLVSASGNIENISNIAVKVAQDAVEENSRNEIDNSTDSSLGIVAGIGVEKALSSFDEKNEEFERNKNEVLARKILGDKTLDSVDDLKSVDAEQGKKLQSVITDFSGFVERASRLEKDKQRRAVSAYLMRAAATGKSNATMEFISDAATEFDIDVFSVDEKGQRVVDYQKVQEQFNIICGKNSTIEDFESINDGKLKLLEKKGIDFDKSTRDTMQRSSRDSKQSLFDRNMREFLKNGGNVESFENSIINNMDYATNFVKESLRLLELAQSNGKDSVAQNIEQGIMKVNGIIKEHNREIEGRPTESIQSNMEFSSNFSNIFGSNFMQPTPQIKNNVSKLQYNNETIPNTYDDGPEQ